MSNAHRTLAALGFAAALQGCLTDPALKAPFEGYAPDRLDDGWEVSTPAAEGMDAGALDRIFEDFFREDRYPTARALLVARHGKLVAEAYARDPGDRNELHNVQSVTKSVTSLLAGIALGEGLLPSVDVPLYEVMPDPFDGDARKRGLTLRHALTQRTGLAFNNDDDTGPFMYSEGSSLEYVLHRPLLFDPGADFFYGDGNPQLVSGAIQAVTGRSLESFAAERLFAPLGIHRWRWERHADGLSFGAVGLWLLPRDMLKIGQLALQEGAWRGERVVPSDWIAESTRVQANGDYGFYWWVHQEGVLYSAKGDGEQMILVCPALDLVVVLTGDPGSRSWEMSPGLGALLDAVLQAAG